MLFPGGSAFFTDKVLIQDLTGLPVATPESSKQVLVENPSLDITKTDTVGREGKVETTVEIQ